MRNTMRNVIMVVAVLITSCQVSLKLKIGPVMAQMMMIITALIKVIGRPVAREAHLAARVNQEKRLPLPSGAILPAFSTKMGTQRLGSASSNWFSFQLLYWRRS